MKSMKKDWYKKGWTLDIQNMSWVEDTNRQVDFLIKQLQLKGTEKILDSMWIWSAFTGVCQPWV